MYCFAKICCLCLQHSQELNKLEEVDQYGLTFFEKLIVLIPGFGKLVKKSIPNYICRRCKRYVNKFYKFQQNCLTSYKLLESYVSKLDNNPDNPEHVIEDDLILIKEDMEECLKNMDTCIKIEDSDDGSDDLPLSNITENTVNIKNKKRTRASSKTVSYNEDYDSETVFSDTEIVKPHKRKRKKNSQNTMDGSKQVIIPLNSIFARDLTRTINGIITRLSDQTTGDETEEVKVKFKNSAGNTEHLSIHRNEDTVEIRFTKEEKNGFLRLAPHGDSIILTHNMSETNLQEVASGLTKKLDDGYMDLQEMSCKICDKNFTHLEELRLHLHEHASNSTLSSESRLIESPNCEMKVLLAEIQENGIKSERSSSPEFQFHLSDDTDDEFDNDTLILDSLDHDNDFAGARSPSPVQLTPQVMRFMEESDPPPPCGALETPETSETKEPQLLNGNGTSPTSPKKEKFLKIVVNKLDVEDFIKKRKLPKQETKKKTSPRTKSISIDNNKVP